MMVGNIPFMIFAVFDTIDKLQFLSFIFVTLLRKSGGSLNAYEIVNN